MRSLCPAEWRGVGGAVGGDLGVVETDEGVCRAEQDGLLIRPAGGDAAGQAPSGSLKRVRGQRAVGAGWGARCPRLPPQPRFREPERPAGEFGLYPECQ